MKQKVNNEASGRKKGAKSLMQRNVTDFRHLLSHCYVTESDLNWAMGLRDNPSPPKVSERKEPAAPEVFFKKTMISTIREELRGKQKSTINVGEYGHMMTKKLEKTPEKQTLEQINFYKDLRKDDGNRFQASKSSKQFDVIPYKDKHQFPSFIRKEHIHKVHVDQKQTESAFDGAQNQLPYTNKMKTRNYAFFEPMARARGRNKVQLPVLAWEMGLRNY